MAAETAQIILAVCRARKIRMILPGGVAFQAALIDFLRRCLFETKDLAGITWIIDVVTSWAVAGLAALLGSASPLIERGLPMRACLETLVDVFMAGLACVRTDVRRSALRQLRFLFLLGGSRTGKYDREGQKEGKLTERRKPGVPELQHSRPHHRTHQHQYRADY